MIQPGGEQLCDLLLLGPACQTQVEQQVDLIPGKLLHSPSREDKGSPDNFVVPSEVLLQQISGALPALHRQFAQQAL